MQHTVKEVRLKNGASGLLINIPQATVMSYDFSLRAGYYLAPKGKWEVPHVMEHMLCGANQEYRKARLFEAEVKKNGAHTNAYTSTYHVGYVAECADFEWDRILNLLLLSISKPMFLQEEFTAEIGNVKEELIGLTSSYFRQLGVALAERAGIKIQKIEKSLKELKNINVSDIRSFYNKTHHLENMRFIIAGNLKGRRDQLVSTIEKRLQLSAGERIALPETTLQKQDAPLYIKNDTVESLYISLSIMIPARISDAEYDALVVLNSILTSTLDSLILGELREKGLAYHIFSSGSRGKDHTVWDFDFQVSRENAKKTIQIIVKHLKKVLEGGITPELLRVAKNYALGSFQMGAQTVGSILNAYNYEYTLMENVIDYERIPDRIKGVTVNRITRIAREFHSQKLWDFGVLGSCGQQFVDELYEELAKLWE